MSSVLITLMSSSKRVTIGNQQVEALDNEIKNLEEEYKSCSGLESGFAQSLHKKVGEARADKYVLEGITKWGKPVSVLDLDEALRWRDVNGLPRVLVFHCDSPRMKMCFRYVRKIPSKFSRKKVEYCESLSHDWSPINFFSGRIDCFDDLKNRLLAEGKITKIGFKTWLSIAGDSYDSFTKESWLIADFKCVISPAMRASIKKAREVFGDSAVYVIAEASEWKRVSSEVANTEATGSEFLLVAVVGKQVLFLDASGVPLAIPAPAMVNGW